MEFLERIRREYSSLTRSQQRLADFIASSYLDAAFLSSTELAAGLDLDPGTVTRFAQRLGYEGFPELADDIQALVKRELRDIWEPPAHEPTIADLFRQSIDSGRRNLEEIIVYNPSEKIEQVVGILEEAERIFILAPNIVAYHQGCLLEYGLAAIGLPVCEVCGDLLTTSLCLRDAREGDVFVAVAYTEYAMDVVTALHQARARRARAIGLVGTVTCDIAGGCEVSLICPARSVVPLPSFLALGGALCALLEVLALRKGVRAEERLRQLQESFQGILQGRE